MEMTREELENDQPAVTNRRQFSLKSALLLTAAIASWVGFFNVRRSRQLQELDLKSLRQLARELDIRYPDQYAAAQKTPTFAGEHVWRIYLPPGKDYRLKLALDQIPTGHTFKDMPNSISPVANLSLDAGEYEVELRLQRRTDGATIDLLIDGETKLELQRDAVWSMSQSSSSSGVVMPIQKTTSKALVLHHETVITPPPSDDGARGALLWIVADK